MNTLAPIRIVIADDHDIFREGLHRIFNKQEQMEIVGETRNGRELVSVVAQKTPHIVLTDVKMPQMDGVEATRLIKKDYPEVGVIALSMLDDESYLVDMMEAGALGYLVKNAPKEEVFQAVKNIAAEEPYYCSTSSLKMLQLMSRSRFHPFKAQTRVHFTDREIQIVRLICQQFSSKEIADLFQTNAKSIEFAREKIREKMGVKNLAGIVMYAVAYGMHRRENFRSH